MPNFAQLVAVRVLSLPAAIRTIPSFQLSKILITEAGDTVITEDSNTVVTESRRN